MTYISLVPYHGEMVIIDNMTTFTGHFCYKIKQSNAAVKDESAS